MMVKWLLKKHTYFKAKEQKAHIGKYPPYHGQPTRQQIKSNMSHEKLAFKTELGVKFLFSGYIM